MVIGLILATELAAPGTNMFYDSSLAFRVEKGLPLQGPWGAAVLPFYTTGCLRAALMLYGGSLSSHASRGTWKLKKICESLGRSGIPHGFSMNKPELGYCWRRHLNISNTYLILMVTGPDKKKVLKIGTYIGLTTCNYTLWYMEAYECT